MKRLFYILIFTLSYTLPISAQSSSDNHLLSSNELQNQKTYDNIVDALANPEKVYKLSLDDQGLKSLSPDIGKLKNLQHLSLTNCKLNELPPELFNCRKLQVLNLYGNRLKYFPSELRNLSKLEVLNLAGNRITMLPVWLGAMGQLRQLNISRNRISPQEITSAKQMMPRTNIIY